MHIKTSVNECDRQTDGRTDRELEEIARNAPCDKWEKWAVQSALKEANKGRMEEMESTGDESSPPASAADSAMCW